jgi:porphobilinogen synthase
MELHKRLRRLRYHPTIRDLIRETYLTPQDLVAPIFIKHGSNLKIPIPPMPGYFQWSIDRLEEKIHEILEVGLSSVLLFGIPEVKDSVGSDSYDPQGIIQRAIRRIKSIAPDLLVISDICFCEYTDHGHCGVMNDKTGRMDLDNDETLALLVRQAVSHAQAGTDVIAPSGMIDGMVQAIRYGLDQAGFSHIPILSYSIKYCSTLYSPFRVAAEGPPRFGDRRTYQMDPANGKEALREASLDLIESADILMVKPAHTYLDIIHRVKEAYPTIPLGAYHTSGEFAMLKAAINNGWIPESTMMEVLTAIKRAGADFIITYCAEEAARYLKNQHLG